MADKSFSGWSAEVDSVNPPPAPHTAATISDDPEVVFEQLLAWAKKQKDNPSPADICEELGGLLNYYDDIYNKAVCDVVMTRAHALKT